MAGENMGILGSQLDSMMTQNPWLLALIVIVLIWKLIWYGFAIYNSIEKKQKGWFVALFVCAITLNDVGLLAILYLAFNKDKKQIKKSK